MLQDPVAGSMDRRQKIHPEQALKCPRCDSTNTKFCYYNNYNLAQPRHFCKTCRRYWTKGGSLRNVPIGGGCRKNKKLRQRTLDPSSIFQGIHDPTSNMLATIDRESCSSLLGSLSAPSTSTYVDLSNQGHGFSLTLSRLQEALRLRDQFGTVQSNHPVFEPHLNRSSEVAQELLSPSSCRLTPFTANLTSLRFPSSINVKEEHSLQYSSADLCPLFEANRHIASPKVATLEEQFSTYSAPNEHVRHQQKGLRLQLVHDAQNGGQAGQEILPGFEEDTKEYLKHIKGCQKGRFYESYYDNEDGYNFWINNNIEWPEFHALG